MNKKNSHTAFLVFIRTAEEEARAKRFCTGLHKSGNRFIASKLNQRIITAVKQTAFPYYVISSDQQSGRDFGERITHSIDKVFAKGYERVIVVGNDCPSLTVNSLIEMADQLTKHDLVLGPTFRGGLYAIGLCRKAYQSTVFQNFQWESEYLFNNFKDYAEKSQIRLFTLNLACDINNAFDFYSLAKQWSSLALLKKELRSFLASSIKAIISKKNQLRIFTFEYEIILRGPPTVSTLS